MDRRSEIDSPVEPRLHRVLIGGNDILEMSRLKRAQMRIDDGGGHFVSSAALRQIRKKARAKNDGENGGGGESEPPCRANGWFRANRSDGLHGFGLGRLVCCAQRRLKIASNLFRRALA